MTRFRLLADDLTGALDSAARFAGRFGTVPVAWAEQPDAGVLALDSDSRDLPQAEAERRVAALAPALAGADLAFLKIDSLLRGHIAAELAVCMAAGQYNAVAIVPAFPAQGRITRHGRQLAHGSDVGVDLAGQLAARGVPVALRRPGDALPPGVSYWDAETDADLAEIATMARGRVLWCGTGGLAGALGGAIPTLSARLPRPAFALIGSNHPAAIAQLRACRSRLTLTGPDDPAVPADGAAIDVAVPAGFGHAAAADMIARSFAASPAALADEFAGQTTKPSECNRLAEPLENVGIATARRFGNLRYSKCSPSPTVTRVVRSLFPRSTGRHPARVAFAAPTWAIPH